MGLYMQLSSPVNTIELRLNANGCAVAASSKPQITTPLDYGLRMQDGSFFAARARPAS